MSNVLRVTPDQYQWLQDNPFVWFAAFARAEFNRVTPGEPGTEYEDDGETVAFRVWGHPDIDGFDLYILQVILAGKAYAESLGDEDGASIIFVRAVADLEAFLAIVEQVHAGVLTHAAATVLIRAEAVRQGDILGVPTYTEPVADDELLD